MTDKIEYLLTCLMEECSEVQKEASKALRFGLDDTWKGEPSPAFKLTKEFYEVVAIFEMLDEMGVLPKMHTEHIVKCKKEKTNYFIEYSRKRGILNESTD